MPQIASRELRNDVSAVLRRVEAGEELTVTVSGRPVGRLAPLGARPQAMPWPIFAKAIERAAADPGLAAELSELLDQTTDDIP